MKNLVDDEELEGNQYDVDNFIKALEELTQSFDWELTASSSADLNDVWRVILKKYKLPSFHIRWRGGSRGYHADLSCGKLSIEQRKELWDKLPPHITTYNHTYVYINHGHLNVFKHLR